jgi:uncharacterized membrane protein
VSGEKDGSGAWARQRREKVRVAAERGARRKKYLMASAILLAAVLVVAGTYVITLKGSPKPPARPLGDRVQDHNQTHVSITASSVTDTAKFYKWNATGKTLRFFAVLGSDGQVRTAFDNAYCCYRKDLGERQEGRNIVCNWCNKAYPIDELNRGNLNATTILQCCPANLPSEVAGNDVLIRKSDLEAGGYLFK